MNSPETMTVSAVAVNVWGGVANVGLPSASAVPLRDIISAATSKHVILRIISI
jgi:hypothetical protein